MYYDDKRTKEQIEADIQRRLSQEQERYDSFIEGVIQEELRFIYREKVRSLLRVDFTTHYKELLHKHQGELLDYAKKYLAIYQKEIVKQLHRAMADRAQEAFRLASSLADNTAREFFDKVFELKIDLSTMMSEEDPRE